MNYSKGISWIDDCRIPFTNENINFNTTQKGKVYGRNSYEESNTERNSTHYKPEGRFPANLLCSDDMLNDGCISKSQKGRNDLGKPTYTGNSLLNSSTKMNNTERGFDDKGSNSRYYDIDIWFDELLDKLYLLSDEQNEQK